jgi:hypothetical protein
MGLFSSSAQKTESEPWAPIKKDLNRIVTSTDEARKAAIANQFSGPTYAGLNGTQRGAVQGMTRYGQGPGQDIGGLLGSQAQKLAGYGGNFGANADQLYNEYGGQATQGILDRTNQYFNSPLLQGQVDAMKQSVNQNASEQLAGLNGQYAGTGNINSGRAGVTDSLVMRDANQTIANQEAGMRMGAYNTALGAGQQDYFGGGQMAMDANRQVGVASELGQNAAMGSLNYNQTLNQGLMGAGGVLQQENQNQLNDAYAQWQQKYMQPFGINQQSMGILSPMMGYGQQTATGGDPSFLQMGLGAAAMGAGMYMGMPAAAPAAYGATGAGSSPGRLTMPGGMMGGGV